MMFCAKMAASTMSLVVLVVLVSVEIVHSQCHCHDTWITFNGSCYHFGNNHGVHFTEAEHYCRQHNSHLVKIDSPEENNFIKSYIMQLKGSRYWIGLVDEEIEGVWKWSGTDELVTFTDWNRGEPNSWTALEDCVAIAKDDQGRWYDIECDELYLPICEARGDSTDPVPIFG